MAAARLHNELSVNASLFQSGHHQLRLLQWHDGIGIAVNEQERRGLKCDKSSGRNLRDFLSQFFPQLAICAGWQSQSSHQLAQAIIAPCINGLATIVQKSVGGKNTAVAFTRVPVNTFAPSVFASSAVTAARQAR